MTRPLRLASPPLENDAKLTDSECISDAIRAVPTGDKVSLAAYSPKIGTTQASVSTEEAKMTDKSPRQAMAKKSGKSLKEKRADKRAKSDNTSQAESVLNSKKR
jgi:hypothetical protein